MPLLYVPSDVLYEAETDPTSDAAKGMSVLKRNMSNLHTGDHTHMILPSDVQENASSVRDYELKFLG